MQLSDQRSCGSSTVHRYHLADKHTNHELELHIRMGKKSDLSDFDNGTVVRARKPGLSISLSNCRSSAILTHNSF